MYCQNYEWKQLRKDLVELIYPKDGNVVNGSIVNADLFFINCKLSSQVIIEDLDMGIYDLKVDVSNLKTATYYVRIKSDDNITFKKIVVLGK